MSKTTPVIPGDYSLVLVRDGKLDMGGGNVYSAAGLDGKYFATALCPGHLLLTEYASESGQLLSEVFRGIGHYRAPLHIQGYILPLSAKTGGTL